MIELLSFPVIDTPSIFNYKNTYKKSVRSFSIRSSTNFKYIYYSYNLQLFILVIESSKFLSTKQNMEFSHILLNKRYCTIFNYL